MMEKAFALKSAIPELATNGRIAVFTTTDRRVCHLVIVDSSFQWESRGKQEVFRCGRCGAFVLPGEKRKTKNGVKFHKLCNPRKFKGSPCPAPEVPSEGREPGKGKGVSNDIDIATGTHAGPDVA